MPNASDSNLQAKNSNRFAQPAFIKELGEEGLTATQRKKKTPSGLVALGANSDSAEKDFSL